MTFVTMTLKDYRRVTMSGELSLEKYFEEQHFSQQYPRNSVIVLIAPDSLPNSDPEFLLYYAPDGSVEWSCYPYPTRYMKLQYLLNRWTPQELESHYGLPSGFFSKNRRFQEWLKHFLADWS